MGDSATDKAQKSADIDHKSSTKQNNEQTLEEKKTDLDTTSKELSAAMEVYPTPYRVENARLGLLLLVYGNFGLW